MVVAIDTTDDLRVEAPRELFRTNLAQSPGANYDVSLDGNRFVVVQSTTATGSPQSTLHFVIHFDEELRQRLPG
jgi:hypothetical protein